MKAKETKGNPVNKKMEGRKKKDLIGGTFSPIKLKLISLGLLLWTEFLILIRNIIAYDLQNTAARLQLTRMNNNTESTDTYSTPTIRKNPTKTLSAPWESFSLSSLNPDVPFSMSTSLASDVISNRILVKRQLGGSKWTSRNQHGKRK